MKENLEKRINNLKEKGFVAAEEELEKYDRYIYGEFANNDEILDYYENVLIKQESGIRNLIADEVEELEMDFFIFFVSTVVWIGCLTNPLTMNGSKFLFVGNLLASVYSSSKLFLPKYSISTTVRYYLNLRKYEKILGIKRKNVISKIIDKFKSMINNRNNNFKQLEKVEKKQETSELDPFIQKVAEAYQIIKDVNYSGKLEDLKELKQLAGDYILANKPTTNTSSNGLNLVLDERNFFAELINWETRVNEKIKQQDYLEKNIGYINSLGKEEEPVSLTLDVKSPTLDVSLLEEGPRLTLGKKGQ